MDRSADPRSRLFGSPLAREDAEIVRFLVHHQQLTAMEARLAVESWRREARERGLAAGGDYTRQGIAWLRERYPAR